MESEKEKEEGQEEGDLVQARNRIKELESELASLRSGTGCLGWWPRWRNSAVHPENPTENTSLKSDDDSPSIHHGRIDGGQEAHVEMDAKVKYETMRLEEKNKRLLDLVESMETLLRQSSRPVIDVPHMSDTAVMAMLGHITCSEIDHHDIIPFQTGATFATDFSLQEIGRGAYAKVLLGRHAHTRERLAIKVPTGKRKLKTKLTAQEAKVCQFMSESKHFPKMHGLVKIEGTLCIAQEFIGDKTNGNVYPLLRALVKDNPQPVIQRDNMLKIAEDIVKGIYFMHAKGFLHNDIKVDNVLLECRDHQWRAFIIDLGVASTIACPPQITIHADLMKTHHDVLEGQSYLAPELFNDGGPLSVSSDIYSVGVILVLIGRAVEIEGLVTIGQSCMATEPHQRPFSIGDVLDDVRSLVL